MAARVEHLLLEVDVVEEDVAASSQKPLLPAFESVEMRNLAETSLCFPARPKNKNKMDGMQRDIFLELRSKLEENCKCEQEQGNFCYCCEAVFKRETAYCVRDYRDRCLTCALALRRLRPKPNNSVFRRERLLNVGSMGGGLLSRRRSLAVDAEY
ncbi:hypothetical protein EJB05_45474, partial [Eragrostis curvula]